MPWYRLECKQTGCNNGVRVNGFGQVRNQMQEGWAILDGARPLDRYRLDWDTITLRGWYSYTGWFCPDCMNSMTKLTCDECSGHPAYVHDNNDEEEVRYNYFQSFGDRKLCEECHAALVIYCRGHGDYCDREGAERATGGGGSFICAACLSTGNYSNCDSCNYMAHQDDILYDEDQEEYACYNCRANQQESTRRSAVQYYSYRPNRFIIRDAQGQRIVHNTNKYRTLQHRGRVFGVELEVEPVSSMSVEASSKAASVITKYGDGNIFYCKEDASIGPQGFEVVSHPCTYQWWMTRGKEYIEEMTNELRTRGFKSHNGGHCGLHIHVNRWPITHLQHYKLAQFIYSRANSEMLKTISRRNNMDYASLRVDNPDNFAKQVGKRKYGGSRWALNQASDDTVELRLFRGTLKPERFLAAIQFYDALLNYTSNADGAGLDRFTSWNKFTQYAALHRNNYKYLTNEIEEFNLQCV